MAIMHRLQNVILEHADVVHKVVELTAELDCLLALASAAKEFNLTRPILHKLEKNVTNIKGGRHLLQELCVNQFVANDTVFNGSDSHIKILTGPNASGKSVYLKQVGLIIYLAQIGSYVPAEFAEISLKDALFTRIHTKESVSVPLSTFMIDLNQISFAVSNTTKHSVVIIDEFGKGTSSVDGLALLYASLKYWIDKGTSAPMVLVSTHFHRLLEMLPTSLFVTHQTMEVMHTEDELVLLYNLKDGFVDNSYAHVTAQVAMIPENILKRARQISDCIKRNVTISKHLSPNDDSENCKLARIAGEFLNMNIELDDVKAFLNKLT